MMELEEQVAAEETVHEEAPEVMEAPAAETPVETEEAPVEEAEAVLEETAAEAPVVEAPATGKKKKALWITLIAGAGVLVMALSVILGVPFGRYLWASYVLEQGQYQKAWMVFEDLGGFLSSPEKLKACKIGQAEVWLRDGDYEDAKDLYLELGDGENAKECDYRQALAWMDQDKVQEAQEIFQTLGDYKDSAQQVVECQYRQVTALMAQGSYQRALELIMEMGTYKDSDQQATECKYQIALTLLEKGNHAQAQEMFTALEDYKDSKDQIKECKYQAALVLLEEGEIVKGYDALIALKNYKDSAAKAKSVKTTYDRIKAKPKIFRTGSWYLVEADRCGLRTKVVNSTTVKITIGWADSASEDNIWEFTCKWDPKTGRANYTKGVHYHTEWIENEKTGEWKEKKTYLYKNGTGYFYYQNSRLHWKANNDNMNGSVFKYY